LSVSRTDGMKRTALALLALAALVFGSGGETVAQNWATPTDVSNTSGLWEFGQSFTVDTRGKVHITYVTWNDSTAGKVYCTNNDTPDGTFAAPAEVPIPGYWLYDKTTQLTHTSDDKLHLVVTVKISGGSGAENVIYMNKPLGGAWSSPLLLTSDTTEFTRSHGIAALPDDSVFVLMVDDNDGYPRLLDRVRSSSGTWSGEETLYTSDVGGRWPAGWCRADDGDLYVSYDRAFCDGAYYRVKHGGVWGNWKQVGSYATQTASRLTIAKSPVTGELAACYGYDTGDGESFGSGNLNFDIYARFSSDNGLTWGPQIRVSPGNSLDRGASCVYDAAGILHVVWYGQVNLGDYGSLLYRKRTVDGQWGALVNVSNNAGRTSTAFEPIQVFGNKLSLVYTNSGNPPSGPGYEDIWYSWMISPAETDPPGPVTNLSADPGEERANLSWHNPSDSDLQSVLIRESTTGYPVGPGSGNLIASLPATPNADQSHLAIPLTPNVTHYFSIFAQDQAGNFSAPAQVPAVPVPDVTAPGSPVGFAAAADYAGNVTLTWTNASDPDLKGTVIRSSTTGYPADVSSGTLVVNQVGAPGAAQNYVATGLSPNQTYYFSAFAYDAKPNYSPASKASASTTSASVGAAKRSPDGASLKLYSKVVAAIFSSDGCIYVQEPDRSAGIRVASSGSGQAIGDVVDVSGTAATRYLSNGTTNIASERLISPATVTRLSAGTPPSGAAMVCRHAGGASVPPYVPGVNDGVGLNSMGLLVSIVGKVTYKLTYYIWVDDGSQVEDVSGRTGVMVKCPTTSIPANVGNLVCVTGVLEGSVPTGWTTNRRYLRIRDYNDLKVCVG